MYRVRRFCFTGGKGNNFFESNEVKKVAKDDLKSFAFIFWTFFTFSCLFLVQVSSSRAEVTASTDYFVNVKDFGAKGDGLADDTAAIQSAIDSLYVNNYGGGTVYFPPGRYRLVGTPAGDSFQGRALKNGILLKDMHGSIARPTVGGKNHRVTLRGAGKASVLAADVGEKDLVMIRVATGYVTIKDMALFGGTEYGTFKTGVIGIGMFAENMQDATKKTGTTYNVLENLHIGNVQEGIMAMCGPTVSGANSNCYRNSFHDISINSAVRGIFLASGLEGAAAVNRNYFENISVSNANVGLHIESGDTNTCMHCIFSKINLEEKPFQGNVPREIATGLVIDTLDVWGTFANAENRFYNVPFSDNNRDIENRNTRSEFYGVAETALKNSLWEVPPSNLMGTGGQFFQWPGVHVGLKTLLPDPTVILGAYSDTGGFLPPRMSTQQRDDMGNVPEGLIIYNTTTKNLNISIAGVWKGFGTN